MYLSGIRGRSCLTGLALFFCAVISGCGGADAKPSYFADLVIVNGKVTLDGAPVSEAIVTYTPVDLSQSGGTGSGMTSESGEYSLITPRPGSLEDQPQGVVPGAYTVTITKLVMPDGSPIPEGTDDAMAMAMNAKELIPAKYSDPEKTELKVDVEYASPFVRNFELVSK